MTTPAGIVSTRDVIRRWRDAVEQVVAVNGNLYYIGPGTTSFNLARRKVTPSDNADGLTPFTPLATPNEFITNRAVSGDGDIGVLMQEGTYTLGANIDSSKDKIGLLGAPGLHPRGVSVVGVTGGPPLTLRGNYLKLMNFSINSADALYGDLIVEGNYAQLIKMMLDSGASVTPLWGLKLRSPLASLGGQTGAFLVAKYCNFADCATGLLFDSQLGALEAFRLSDWLIEECIFRHNTTRDVGQSATNYAGNTVAVDAGLIHKCVFQGVMGTDFIKLDNADNGGSQMNTISDNVFAHNAITATQVLLTNTTTAFKFIGNRDKAGFITGV